MEACFDVVIFTWIGSGSLELSAIISGGTYSSSAEASSSISSAFSSNTQLDGLSVLTVSTSASGYAATTASSSTNLGLILGLSIPLVLLRTFGFI